MRTAAAELPGMNRWDPLSAAVVVVYKADRSLFNLGIVLNSLSSVALYSVLGAA